LCKAFIFMRFSITPANLDLGCSAPCMYDVSVFYVCSSNRVFSNQNSQCG
jgi:hypothetical protein